VWTGERRAHSPRTSRPSRPLHLAPRAGRPFRASHRAPRARISRPGGCRATRRRARSVCAATSTPGEQSDAQPARALLAGGPRRAASAAIRASVLPPSVLEPALAPAWPAPRPRPHGARRSCLAGPHCLPRARRCRRSRQRTPPRPCPRRRSQHPRPKAACSHPRTRTRPRRARLERARAPAGCTYSELGATGKSPTGLTASPWRAPGSPATGDSHIVAASTKRASLTHQVAAGKSAGTATPWGAREQVVVHGQLRPWQSRTAPRPAH